MGKEHRGFASMNKSKQREIASKGGKAAHAKGVAHQWTSAEAIKAGQKGGLNAAKVRWAKKQEVAVGEETESEVGR
jgi:general stress protein YciG